MQQKYPSNLYVHIFLFFHHILLLIKQPLQILFERAVFQLKLLHFPYWSLPRLSFTLGLCFVTLGWSLADYSSSFVHLFPQIWHISLGILQLLSGNSYQGNSTKIKDIKTSYSLAQSGGNSSFFWAPCKAPSCFVLGQKRWKIPGLWQIIVQWPHPSFSKQFKVKDNLKEC